MIPTSLLFENKKIKIDDYSVLIKKENNVTPNEFSTALSIIIKNKENILIDVAKHLSKEAGPNNLIKIKDVNKLKSLLYIKYIRIGKYREGKLFAEVSFGEKEDVSNGHHIYAELSSDLKSVPSYGICIDG